MKKLLTHHRIIAELLFTLTMFVAVFTTPGVEAQEGTACKALDSAPNTFRCITPYEDTPESINASHKGTVVICELGQCLNATEGTPKGMVWVDDTLKLSIPANHYVIWDVNKDVPYVYATGTGPFPDDYPVSVRVNPPRIYAPLIPDVWCGPQSDTCVLDHLLLTHSELPKYLPMAEVDSEEGIWFYCSLESCFNDHDEFIGLNPFYHEYH